MLLWLQLRNKWEETHQTNKRVVKCQIWLQCSQLSPCTKKWMKPKRLKWENNSQPNQRWLVNWWWVSNKWWQEFKWCWQKSKWNKLLQFWLNWKDHSHSMTLLNNWPILVIWLNLAQNLWKTWWQRWKLCQRKKWQLLWELVSEKH